MTDVFDILLGVGRKLPASWHEGQATGGSTTTIVDIKIGSSDDVYNEGTALIWDTTDDAAPKGESAVISDYVAGSGVVTLSNALTAAVASGDRYGLIKPRFERGLIIGYINDALSDIKLHETDDTSLDTVSDTKSYALPAGVNADNLLQVWIASATAAPFNWSRIYQYTVDHDGGTHTLRFYNQPISSRDIRLVYWASHAEVANDSDTIDPRIHKDLLTWMTVRRVLEWRYFRFSAPPDRETNALNASLRREDEMVARWMPVLPQDTPKFGRHYRYNPETRVPIPPVS